MLYTKYGEFDGDNWEEICQLCFNIRYKKEGYQEIPAHFRGDMGIEGYTRDGLVFQCYCPDEQYTLKELYEKQKQKINRDLSKLKKNEDELAKYFGGQKIRKWYFITPAYHNKEIVKYCVEKRDEYRKENLQILSDDFDVLIMDIKFLFPEILMAIDGSDEKLNIIVDEVEKEKIEEWKLNGQESIQFKNLQRKSSILIPNKDKCDKFINNQIKHNLKGIKILNTLKVDFQPKYEMFLQAVSSYESDVEDMCLFYESSNSDLVKQIRKGLEGKLHPLFKNTFNDPVIGDLTRYTIADWLMRCPLDFE